METSQLIDSYADLQSMIEREGPGPRAQAVRGALRVIYRLFRAQQRYERLKRRTGVVIEFFECDRPLTAQDDANLARATALDRRIGVTLRELKAACAPSVAS